MKCVNVPSIYFYLHKINSAHCWSLSLLLINIFIHLGLVGSTMENADNCEKLALFNEFFSIEHQFTINAKVIEPHLVADYSQFLERIPAPFKMVGEMSMLDQSALNPLQALSGVATQLVEYLNHQAQKIDLLMGYMLSQQDDHTARFQGTSFGGGGVSFISETSFTLNDIIELKIFIQDDNCAIYCYGEIIDITDNNECYDHKVVFHFIRDEDREALVRASLHKQSKQLQQLAKQRNKASSE